MTTSSHYATSGTALADPRYRADSSPVLPCADRPELYDEPVADPWPAKVLCHVCPVLFACRRDSLRTDVAGIAGGLTEAERAAWRVGTGTVLPVQVSPLTDRQVVADHKHGKTRSPLIAEIIARRAGLGQDDAQIGGDVGMARDTVRRYREHFGIDAGVASGRVDRPEPMDDRCGTHGALKRHRQRQERPCQVCADAQAARERANAARSKAASTGGQSTARRT